MTEVEARLWPVAQFATNQQLIQGLSIQERDSDKGVGGGGWGGRGLLQNGWGTDAGRGEGVGTGQASQGQVLLPRVLAEMKAA